MSEAAPDQEIRKSIDKLKTVKDQLQAEATRRLIDMEDGGSHRSSLSRRSKSSLRSRNSGRSSISSKAMDAETEAAANRAEITAQREEVLKQEELRQLELEMERKREALNRTRTEKCLRIAEAKAKVCNQELDRENRRSNSVVCANSSRENPAPSSERISDVAALAQVFSASVVLNRLPAPDPPVFTGTFPSEPWSRNGTYLKQIRSTI